MANKYQYTNQKELRKAFFELIGEYDIDCTGKKTKFDLSLSMLFEDWKDRLQKDGAISDKLCFRAHLY